MNIDTPTGLTLLTLGSQTVLPATNNIGTNTTADDWLAFEHALQAQLDQLQTAENSVVGATDASIATSLNTDAAASLFASAPVFALASGKFLPPTTPAAPWSDIDLAETLDRLQSVLRHISAARGEEAEVSALTLTDERIFETPESMIAASAEQSDVFYNVDQEISVSETLIPTPAESPNYSSIPTMKELENLGLNPSGSAFAPSMNEVVSTQLKAPETSHTVASSFQSPDDEISTLTEQRIAATLNVTLQNENTPIAEKSASVLTAAALQNDRPDHLTDSKRRSHLRNLTEEETDDMAISAGLPPAVVLLAPETQPMDTLKIVATEDDATASAGLPPAVVPLAPETQPMDTLKIVATEGDAISEKTAGFVAVSQNIPLPQSSDDDTPASFSTETETPQDESWMARLDATLASVAPSVLTDAARQANAMPSAEPSGEATSVNLPADTGEAREWSVLDRLMRRNADLLDETTPALREVAAEPSKTSQESVVGNKPVLFDQTWAQRLSALNTERSQDDTKPSLIELQRPINHPQWAEDLGEKVVWLGQQSRTSAEIHLNPQSLGPISIKIDMDQDRATIAFGAQHAVTREALEAALPKLREMLGSQNIQLTEVDISQHGYPGERSQSGFSQFSGQEQRTRQDSADFSANYPPLQQPERVEDIENTRQVLGQGLVSYYV